MEHFSYVIVGGGIAGLMCAYRLAERKPQSSVVILEKGKELEERNCPVLTHRTEKCVKCSSCAIMEGLAGAGAFSDGKYNITTQYGGWLPEVMDRAKVMNYILQADEILMRHGAQKEYYEPYDELKTLCLRYDLHMLQGRVKHLGTDANYYTMQNLIASLKKKIEIRTGCDVTDADKNTRTVMYTKDGKEYQMTGDYILFAVGRTGSRGFEKWCVKNGIGKKNNQVDVGVRVELPYEVWKHFSSKIYEPKIMYRGGNYRDNVRMFCFNERGHVVTENTDGVLTVNGHSYKDEERKSANSNFALLSGTRFTEPFNQPVEYAREIASLANKISGGYVLVQRLGDLEDGKRTNELRLAQSTVRPTLNAVPGDLSLCMPKRQLDNIVSALHALDKVAPGTANYDTLLYGVECKYYSARPECVNFELKDAPGFYALGDGAGFTRSLSQAAANGLVVADILADR